MSPAVISLIILGIIAVILITDKLPLAGVAMGGGIVCGVLGLIGYTDIFSGMADSTAILLISMSIVGASLFHTGTVEKICNVFIKITGSNERGLCLAVMIVAAAFSSFCSNMAVVVAMMPIVTGICKTAKISPSKLMLPLSFAAGVGGSITLIGTASSPAANSALENLTGESLRMMDFAWVGVPCTIAVIIYMVVWGIKMLPDNEINLDTYEYKVSGNTNKFKMWLCGIVVAVIVVVMAVQPANIPLYMVSSVGALILVLTGCITEKQCYESICWENIAILAGMGAISSAVSATGGGEIIGNFVLNFLGEDSNPYFITAVIFGVVCLMTHFIGNVGVASLMAPIAIYLAEAININPITLVLVVAIASNTVFMTPVGTGTLTIVREPGQYKFMDYVKVGAPAVLLCYIISVVISPLAFSFH